MRILQIVHTALRFEPPVFALGSTLAKRGHEVVCVGYWEPGLQVDQEVCSGYRLHRVPRGGAAALPRIVRGGLRFYRYWQGVKRCAQEFDPQLVVSMSYDGLVLGSQLVRDSRRRFIYYCTEYTPPPGLHEYSTGWGFVKRLERLLVALPERVYSVEPNRAFLQAREWGRPVDHVILNAPPYDPAIERMAEAAIASRCEDARALRMVFAGTIDDRNCIPGLLSALASAPGVELDLWGRIVPRFRSRFEGLVASARAAGAAVVYRGEVPYADLPSVLTTYDVGVSLYDDSQQNTRLASPAKLFDYMRAGLCLVSSAQPTPRAVISASGSGYSVPPGDAEALGQAIRSLAADRPAMLARRQASLRAFRDHYAYEIQAAPLLQWVHDLAAIPRAS